MTKEKKIESEWDKLIPNSQLDICKNTGFVITYCINGIDDLIDNSVVKESDIEFEYLESDLIKWRPKSLKGIENNNGWIKIESEADLPKESGFYYVVDSDSKEVTDRYFEIENYDYFRQFSTHYQPIRKPELPIY